MKTHLRLLVLALIVSAFGFTFAGSTISSKAPDAGRVPIIVTPANDPINDGDSDNITVTMDGVVNSDTVVSLSCNSSELSVPTTITVLNGHSTASFQAAGVQYRSAKSSRASGARSTLATITATANNVSAQGTVTIN